MATAISDSGTTMVEAGGITESIVRQIAVQVSMHAATAIGSQLAQAACPTRRTNAEDKRDTADGGSGLHFGYDANDDSATPPRRCK